MKDVSSPACPACAKACHTLLHVGGSVLQPVPRAIMYVEYTMSCHFLTLRIWYHHVNEWFPEQSVVAITIFIIIVSSP